MRSVFILCFSLLARPLCAQDDNKELKVLFDRYQQEESLLNPLGATYNGDYRHNDQLPVTFTDGYLEKYEVLLRSYLAALSKIKRGRLNEQDAISYELFRWRAERALEGLRFKGNRMPLSHFDGMHLTLAQAGGGGGFQPFKTVADYVNWVQRAGHFSAWADSAIAYMRKGIAEGIVLPKNLVAKLVPQLASLVVTDPTQSVFYGPVRNFPEGFGEADKARLTTAYTELINAKLLPSFQRLLAFLKEEYGPAARASDGWGGLPGGTDWYAYLVRQSTTTALTPDEIFNLGQSEVRRIRLEMERVKDSVGFGGTLDDYIASLRSGQDGGGYGSMEAFLAAYKAIEARIAPRLKQLFVAVPRTGFEVRPIEGPRAGSSPAHYIAGLGDGSRAGIFYVPVIDATRAKVRESLFIHEAVPGHHYQIMLQRENDRLPPFRRLGGFTAFAEGWGLYAESLGRELGLYKDEYQYMNALLDELFRAARLVADPGLHAKGWTREAAIRYMQEQAFLGERGAALEVERYMAMPGQAVSYKIGALKLLELRGKYSRQLGPAFDLAQFHHQVLKDGALPLHLLEKKLETWAGSLHR